MRFYFCAHPSDLTRTRLPAGVNAMAVASAHWSPERNRFRIHRPPADHLDGFVIDSGGFTTARRWGHYPWSCEQYVEFLRAESRDLPLLWAASMDYACERGVDRSALATNQERIRASIENELALRRIAPEIPWLGVLQGNTLAERRFDVRCRRTLGLVHSLMGVGSICGRGAREAAAVLRFYRDCLPGVRFHAFGMDCRTLDQGGDVAFVVESWDSYAWTWARGKKGHTRPSFLVRHPGETRSAFTLRLGHAYWSSAVEPRLNRPRQLPLEMVA